MIAKDQRNQPLNDIGGHPAKNKKKNSFINYITVVSAYFECVHIKILHNSKQLQKTVLKLPN